MTTNQVGALLPYIRDWASRRGACVPSDHDLLERFIRSREQAAFATLMARHGPRVLGVCRRVLRDEHAAEDAFQNVFLLLARKAGAIRERTLLGGWLYGAACRIAAHARADAARRQAREAQAPAARPPDDPAVAAAARELSAVLDEEVGRLPDRYRSLIVLCHVEGRTREEAARQMGCSPRTLQRRLERGRAVLRARLARRGVALSAALIAPSLWVRPVDAAVSAQLASTVVQAGVAAIASTAPLAGLAVAASSGAMRTYLLTRIQIALGLLVVGCLVGTGVGVACYGAAKQVPGTPPAAGAQAQAAAPDRPAEPHEGDVPMPIDPKLLAQLAEQLRSKNWDECTAAVAALEKLIPEKGAGETDFGPVIEPLFANCGWGGEATKNAEQAEELIARIGAQAAPFLRRRLESTEPRERRVAARLLARVEPSGPGLTDELRPLLEDADKEVRRAAIKGLGAQGPAAKAAISDLEKESTDPSRVNRVDAAVALIHIAGPSDERVGALADLLRLKKDPEDEAAVYAAMELGRLGRQAHSAAPQLLAALKNPDVRYAAADALGPVGADPATAVPALLALLKDETDGGGRLALARALGLMGPAAASAIPALHKTLREEEGAGIGWLAAEAIGKIGGPDAVAALVEALESKDDQVRYTAIKWLGNLGGAAASAVEALKKAEKDDPQESNRKAAAKALQQITGTAPAGAPPQVAAADKPSEPRQGDAPMPIDPKLLAQLAEQLRSKSWDERNAAMAALEKLVPTKGAGEMDFHLVIDPLLDLCGWGGPSEKDAFRAEGLIVRIGTQAGPSIRQRLQSPDAHDRRVAAELLVRVEPAGAGLTDLLRPLLADKDNFVRRAAMQGLGAQGAAAKAAISDLEKASIDPNLGNRVTACVALIRIAGPSDERIGALADFLRLKEPCDGAAAYAAAELGQLGREAKSAAPQLLDALKHPDAQVRVYAAGALSSVGADPDKAVPALLALLKDDPEREARRSAAGALGDMGPAAVSAIPALREALRGDGGGWWVAADAIGKIGGPDAVAALIEALANKNDDVRQTAMQRLGDLGSAAASAVEALKKAEKDDPRESNRKAAARALEQITGRPSPPM